MAETQCSLTDSSIKRPLVYTAMDNNTQQRSNRLKLYITVFSVNLLYLTCGCMYGWTSPTLAQLQAPGSWLPVTDSESSWIASLLPMGSLIGPLLSGISIDLIGRKGTMLFIIMLFISSWVLLFFAESVYILYLARFVFGIGDGATYTGIPLYIAEIAEDNVRSAVGTISMIFVHCGILLVYCIGPYISYHLLIKIVALPSIIFLIILPWLPESPYYLVYKNNTNKAVKNLRWLRGDISESSIEKEISDVKTLISENMTNKSSLKDVISTRGCRRGLVITCGLLFLQQATGATIILFYAEPIFKMTGTAISASASSIIISIVNVIVAMSGPPMINHFGYKKPLIISACGMFFTHLVLGVYLFLAIRNYDVLSFNWIPIISVAACFAAFGIGFSNAPWAVMGELFPTNVKGLAAAISTTVCSLSSFLVTNLFLDFLNLIGIDFVFFLFAVVCLISVFFIIFLLPETNGLSLAEIQELLNNPDHNKNIKAKINDKFLSQELKSLE